MGRFVIVAYRPKEGCADRLDAVVAKHLRILREQGLITDHEGYVMRAGDGTVVEVFEWRSEAAIEEAHGNAAVGALWAEFGAVCDYVPLASLPQSQQMFAEFDAA
jgi:hypothetical protein